MDWLAALAILIFAARGMREGIVRQVFDLLGWFGGFWSFIVISQWVGAHWQGARPAVVFGVLRWLVATLAGFAVLALFQLWGERIGESVRKSMVGWLDRVGGFVLGAAVGAAVVAAFLVAMLITPWPRQSARVAAAARNTGPLLTGARILLDVDDRFIPGLGGVRHVLGRAIHRARDLSRQS